VHPLISSGALEKLTRHAPVDHIHIPLWFIEPSAAGCPNYTRPSVSLV
jgi:hypothetical protein